MQMVDMTVFLSTSFKAGFHELLASTIIRRNSDVGILGRERTRILIRKEGNLCRTWGVLKVMLAMVRPAILIHAMLRIMAGALHAL